ncbi:MAG: hypothetical protein ACYTEQ_24205 [Planctomycetota bacterium]|jgi:hypothetical protein
MIKKVVITLSGREVWDALADSIPEDVESVTLVNAVTGHSEGAASFDAEIVLRGGES